MLKLALLAADTGNTVDAEIVNIHNIVEIIFLPLELKLTSLKYKFLILFQYTIRDKINCVKLKHIQIHTN